MIDLSKAPAGATHWCKKHPPCWMKKNGRNWHAWHDTHWSYKLTKNDLFFEDGIDQCEPIYLESTPEEDEAFNAINQVTTSTGSRGVEHDILKMEPPSKYHVRINGDWCDVYDVLQAFNVTNPGDQHAIKKMLLPGKRGHKDGIADRKEAIQSLERAIELEEQK